MKYTLLMRAETNKQKVRAFMELQMSNKHIGLELQFLGCYSPSNGYLWPDNKKPVILMINNKIFEDVNSIALFTVKWFLGDAYNDVKRIRISGVWNVNNLPPYKFENEDYDLPSKSMFKSTVNQSVNNYVKVSAKAGEIVITGAYNDEKIKEYNISGVAVRSTLTKADVTNINLPKKQF